jgi:hypothetical protein
MNPMIDLTSNFFSSMVYIKNFSDWFERMLGFNQKAFHYYFCAILTLLLFVL